jgi:hypothetical protein
MFPSDEHFPDDRWIENFVSDEYGKIMFTIEAIFDSKWVIMVSSKMALIIVKLIFDIDGFLYLSKSNEGILRKK